MLFQISCRYADTCGNESEYPYKVVAAVAQEDVERVFPTDGAFVTFVVAPLTVEELPTTVQRVPDERTMI